jgi:hypothetical protein
LLLSHLLLWMPIFSTCALAALDADSQHLRTCCSGCRFSAPAHLLLWMPILSTAGFHPDAPCAFAALDADFQHLRTCCSAPAHLLLWMPVFSTCALHTLDADALQQLRICCSSAREATF